MRTTNAIDRKLLFTKNDKEDPRLGELVELSTPQDISLPNSQEDIHEIFILGYPDHEGIELNGGRTGAAEAPEMIRTSLYKMTPHLYSDQAIKIKDLGNIPATLTLAEKHELGRSLVADICRAGKKWISFGGGHDFGYCDSTGFAEVYGNDAVVINFDAHLDVRPTDKGYNSGTPFYRLLNEFHEQIRFLEVGIQNQCNSKAHLQWAESKGAHIVSLNEITEKGLLEALKESLILTTKKKLFISLDIDVFNSMEAPGCSQSWTTGLKTDDFLTTLTWLYENFQVQGLGIYEVSPRLDTDNRTSKLAALIAHHFIFQNQG